MAEPSMGQRGRSTLGQATPRQNPPPLPTLPTPARYNPPAPAPAPVYSPAPVPYRQAINTALNPFGSVTRPSLNTNQVYNGSSASSSSGKTPNQLKQEAVKVQQAAQIAAQQSALAQAAAIVYGTPGSGGYGYGGGYSGGYGGGYGGYTGGYSSGGGGGGGGATATVGGLPIGDVTSPVSGWASRYLPAMYPDILANPGTIGRDTIKDLGGGEPLQGRFADLSTFAASQLLPIWYFQTAMGQIPKGGDVINRMNEFLKKQATPGGEEVDPMKMLDIVLNEGSKSTSDKQTLGSALFAGMSPAKQAETMQGLINNISNWLANPYFAQAMRNWASTQKDEFISASASASNTYKDPFAKYLKGTALPG